MDGGHFNCGFVLYVCSLVPQLLYGREVSFQLTQFSVFLVIIYVSAIANPSLHTVTLNQTLSFICFSLALILL